MAYPPSCDPLYETLEDLHTLWCNLQETYMRLYETYMRLWPEVEEFRDGQVELLAVMWWEFEPVRSVQVDILDEQWVEGVHITHQVYIVLKHYHSQYTQDTIYISWREATVSRLMKWAVVHKNFYEVRNIVDCDKLNDLISYTPIRWTLSVRYYLVFL